MKIFIKYFFFCVFMQGYYEHNKMNRYVYLIVFKDYIFKYLYINICINVYIGNVFFFLLFLTREISFSCDLNLSNLFQGRAYVHNECDLCIRTCTYTHTHHTLYGMISLYCLTLGMALYK